MLVSAVDAVPHHSFVATNVAGVIVLFWIGLKGTCANGIFAVGILDLVMQNCKLDELLITSFCSWTSIFAGDLESKEEDPDGLPISSLVLYWPT